MGISPFIVKVVQAAAIATLLIAGAAAAQSSPPRPPQLVRLRPDQVPTLAPHTPPSPPQVAPFPAPGYARWELPPAPPDTYLDDLPEQTEGRHAGFFMRLALGPSYTTMYAQTAEGSMELRAAGAGLGLTLGGALSENFVLFGEIALQSTLDPRVDRGENARPGTSVTTAALGAGLGYYFMPANVYLAGSLLIGQARAVDRLTERLLGKTDLGPALGLSLGKEWWMSPSWTLGLLTRAQLARFRDPGHGNAGAMWDSIGLSAALSVTFE